VLTGSEKAWTALVIGVVVQSLDIVLSFVPGGTAHTVLLIVAGIVGTIGVGLGVYQVTNSQKAVNQVTVTVEAPVKVSTLPGKGGTYL
jgi:hypothetical protein